MCFYHHGKKLKYICIDCKRSPVCSECSLLGKHSGHKVVKVEIDDVIVMMDYINKNLYSSLEKIFNENNIIKNLCENTFEQLEKEKIENLKIIQKQFKLIHQYVQIAESNLVKQIEIVHEKNNKLKSSLLSIILDQNTKLESILSNRKNKENDSLSITNDYQYSNIVLENSKKFEKDKIELLNQLNCQKVTYKQEEIDNFKNSLIELYTISLKSYGPYPFDTKKYICNGDTYYEYYIGIEKDKSKGIAFGHIDNEHFYQLCKQKEFLKVMLLDGFNLTPNLLPKSVSTLCIGDITSYLNQGSIPSSVTDLILMDGFNHQLSKGVIPSSVTNLSIGDIRYPPVGYLQPTSYLMDKWNPFTQLEKFPLGDMSILIPPTVTSIQLMKGFKHKINQYILHKNAVLGVKPSIATHSSIRDIKYIPFGDLTTVSSIHLMDGFNLEINIDLIPNGVTSLSIGNIMRPLNAGSIPLTVEKIKLMDGFSFQLSESVIPNSVTSLSIGNIKYPSVGYLPPTVSSIHLMDGFNHKINQDILPNSVTSLSVGDIMYPLEAGSISSSVTSIHLMDGFNHETFQGIIPNSVTNLSVGNIMYPLKAGSIPSSVTSIRFMDGFDHKLEIDAIPNGVTNLLFGDILCPLEAGSIPSTVTSIQLMDGFSYQLFEGVIPKSVTSLSIGNIKHPSVGYLPPTVTSIHLMDGFIYEIPQVTIPKSVTSLSIGNIMRPLKAGSIPQTVKNIKIMDGFKHELDIIPKGTNLVDLRKPIQK